MSLEEPETEDAELELFIQHQIEQEEQDLKLFHEQQQEEESRVCPHDYEHVDHLETVVADEYRKELYCCVLCGNTKAVAKPFGVRD
jgi:hypothetical protein